MKTENIEKLREDLKKCKSKVKELENELAELKKEEKFCVDCKYYTPSFSPMTSDGNSNDKYYYRNSSCNII